MRATLASFVIVAALTSCSGSPESRTPERPSPEATGQLSAETATPAAAVSLPCAPGVPALVRGKRHNVVGEVFGRPLTSPPSRDHENKILWRARPAEPGDLVITASLNGSGLLVRRRVEGGPGPSIINVPKAGCWTFSLAWPGHHDVVAIRYIHRS
jgi:hypothetical protein